MEVKTDNGWFHIDNIKPYDEEKVIVILERESKPGCIYDFYICESIYRDNYHKGFFLKENSAWKVRYWRRKEIYPYPNGVVKREIDECRKRNRSFQDIVDHQRKCGIKVITISDLINDKDYDYVSYRLMLRDGSDTFAGCFASKNGEIISLDGDIYDKDEEVLSYEEWVKPEDDINNGLTVVVKGEWISR